MPAFLSGTLHNKSRFTVRTFFVLVFINDPTDLISIHQADTFNETYLLLETFNDIPADILNKRYSTIRTYDPTVPVYAVLMKCNKCFPAR